MSKRSMIVRNTLGFLGALSVLAMAPPAGATYNATVTGMVTYIQQIGPALGYTPETITFALANQPSIACGGFQQFIISTATVNDAQTRKNMFAMPS